MADGLNLAQSDEMNKYLGFRILFKKYPTEVALLPTFASRVTLFGTHLSALENEVPDKNVTSTGATIDKNLKKKAVGVYYEDSCQLTRNYAVDIENNTLEKSINYTESSIVHLKDVDVYPKIVAINALITPLLEEVAFKPYNITAKTLSDGLALAASFRDSLHSNSAIQHGQNVAGNTIDARLIPLRADNHSFNMQMTWHKKNANAFYLLYDEVNRINQTGNSITRILGEVFIKGTTTPIAKAVITNVEIERTVTANLLGHFVMEKFLSGLSQYTVTAPGYHPLTEVIKTVRGESLTHNFELEPIV